MKSSEQWKTEYLEERRQLSHGEITPEQRKLSFLKGDFLQLVQDDAYLQGVEDERKRLLQYLLQCCDFTADGKPVVRGSKLYLYPGNDVSKDPMTLEVPKSINYCWFASAEDHAKAIKSNL